MSSRTSETTSDVQFATGPCPECGHGNADHRSPLGCWVGWLTDAAGQVRGTGCPCSATAIQAQPHAGAAAA